MGASITRGKTYCALCTFHPKTTDGHASESTPLTSDSSPGPNDCCTRCCRAIQSLLCKEVIVYEVVYEEEEEEEEEEEGEFGTVGASGKVGRLSRGAAEYRRNAAQLKAAMNKKDDALPKLL